MNISHLKERLIQYQELFDARPERERAIVLICLIFAFLFLWYHLLETPLLNQQQALSTPAQLAKKRTLAIQQQYAKLKLLDSSPDTATREQDALIQTELEALNINPALANKEIMPQGQAQLQIERSFNEDPSLILNSLQEASSNIINNQNNSQPNNVTQTFQLDFHSNYMSTLNYFKKLENLPWFVFINNVEYKVDNYPNARIKVELQIPTLQGVATA